MLANLTKKQRRSLRKQGVIVPARTVQLKTITPLTFNQARIFKAFDKSQNIFAHGSAGTGKTFLLMYLALNQVINKDKYEKVICVRSAVQQRNIGFLPGSIKEKNGVYEQVFREIIAELTQRDDGYEILQRQQRVEFLSTSFNRGITRHNSLFVIDECQNMTWQEISTVLTRVGNNCRVLISGDTRQSDLAVYAGRNDINKLIDVCKRMETFDFIEMVPADIVRSEFCKQFLLTCDTLGY